MISSSFPPFLLSRNGDGGLEGLSAGERLGGGMNEWRMTKSGRKRRGGGEKIFAARKGEKRCRCRRWDVDEERDWTGDPICVFSRTGSAPIMLLTVPLRTQCAGL